MKRFKRPWKKNKRNEGAEIHKRFHYESPLKNLEQRILAL